MKKKIILILPILVLVIILIVITTKINYDSKIDFNIDLEVSTTNTKISADINSFSNNKYEIKEINLKVLSALEEEEIIEAAYNMTNAFNDIENSKYISEIEKYAVRSPSLKIGEDFIRNEKYKEWTSKMIKIEAYAWLFQNRNATFEKINGAKITYASNNRSLVQIYIDNYSLTYGSGKYNLDAIFEYEVVFEESSQMYKINDLNVEWVKDLEEYYQKMDIEERKQNNTSSNALSNVSTYIPEGFTSFDYSKLKGVTSTITTNIYNKNKDSVVIIDSVTDNGVASGSASGFYIRSGVVVTSYDSVYSMIENGAARYYAVDSNDKVHEIEGIVATYPNINIIILKLKEETGVKVTLGDSNTLEKNDPIVVISSSIGLKASIKLGIYFDTLDDDYKIIRTSLPLIDGDSGSAVFNLKGEVVGINTSVSTSNSTYNSGLNNATDITILKDVIEKLNKETFKDIEVIKFSEFNDDEKIEIKNEVNNKIWKKYEKLPIITNYLPLNLYSAYTNNNYLIVRYKQEKYAALSNDDALNLYAKYLTSNSYEKISDNSYSKDGITIRLQNNLGYIIIIVEGVV